MQKITYSIIDQIDKEYSTSQNCYFKINENNNKRMYVVHRTIKEQLNNQRQGNGCTKTRSEVRGGGKKPWKQKGTGRARAGSTRSPLWRGGGVIFGPKTKEYSSKINKKEKALAIKILLHNKSNYTTVIKNLLTNLNYPSTKIFINTITDLGFSVENKKTLIIIENKNWELYLSTRNLSNIEIIETKNLNSLSIIKAEQILLTYEALQQINQVYNEKKE
uniref:Large ribosomal subunit protein uL4c n=1 Tax=Centroceras clavulatum TaxID=159503 RepID=A0A4D6WNJ1_9FLOR|nr:ribosomal protein L4 [Centroceras clavulatum]